MSKTVLPQKITARWIRSRGACFEQRRVFADTFPGGVGLITAEIVRRALTAGLHIYWLADVACESDLYGPCHHDYHLFGGGTPAAIARRLRALQGRIRKERPRA